MNYSTLKDWRKLTKAEKARLKAVYGGRLPKGVTKTLHDTKKSSLEKAKKQLEINDFGD